jgi:hypothetical protein
MIMAKRRGVNRSQAIRDYARDNANAKPKAISEALAQNGIKVSPAYVSSVLTADRKKSGKMLRRGPRRGPARNNPYANLVEAKKLVDQFGSVEKAREALDALADILG